MTRGLATCLALVTTLLGGCTFQTLDIRRPLSVRELPSAEQLAPLSSPEAAKAVAKSLKLTKSAVRTYSVLKYNESAGSMPTENLAEALALMPENPFAWIQLGAQLTLDYQSDAAIRATERGLSVIDALCEQRCTPELQTLRAVGGVNLAMYLTSQERVFEASEALSDVSPALLPGVDKLAYYWAMTHVNLLLGDVQAAADQLHEAELAVPQDARLSSVDLIFRPHYLGNIRRANEHFLQAMIHAKAGQTEAANASVDLALRSFPETWEARLLRANLLSDARDFSAAIRELQAIDPTNTTDGAPVKRRPAAGMIFHPERILLNLGNALIARYDERPDAMNRRDLEKALAAFQRADKIVAKRAARARGRADSADVVEQTPEVSSFFLQALAEEPPVYSDALNNLGEVELRLASLDPTGTHLANAVEAWRKALSDPRWPRRHLALANLTRVYCMTGQPIRALAAADESLRDDPYNIASLEALAKFAEGTQDHDLSARLSEGIARLIWRRRDRYDPGTFEDLLRSSLQRLRSRTETDANARAILLTELVLARTVEEQLKVLERARYPEWGWLTIQMSLLLDSPDDAALEVAMGLIAAPAVAGDWWQRQERADALIARAIREYETGADEAARRELERAVGHGADSEGVTMLNDSIETKLLEKGLPSTRVLAILPFPTIYQEQGQESSSHSLAAAVSEAIRVSGIDALYLDQESIDAGPDDVFSPLQAARRIHAGAVLTGVLATTSDKIIANLTLSDTVTGALHELGPLEESLESIDQLTDKIVGSVLAALRFPLARPAETVPNDPPHATLEPAKQP